MTARTAFVAIAWLAAMAGAAALVLAGNAAPSLTGSGFSPAYFGLALTVLTDSSVGALLTLRRPGNVVGLLLMLAALLLAVTFLGFVFGAVLTEERGRHDVLAGLASLIGPLGIYPTVVVAGPLIALFFPNGRLPGPRWRWPVGAIIAAMAVCSASTLVRPGPIGASFADNPFGVSGFSGSEALWAMGETLGAAGMLFALLLALAAVIVRVRRSEGIELAQLKWFVAANVAFVALLTLSAADRATSPTIFDVLSPLSLSLPPIAVGVAILRYRLYEIDRIISRTLTWAVVTGLLGAVFVGLVFGLQALSAEITGTDTLAVAASTLVAFALFQPVRRRVQTAVDRRFDRSRYDAQRTVEGLAAGLRDEFDLERLGTGLGSVVDQALAPASIGVWLRASQRFPRR